jgi:hypothetical protein
MAKGKKWERRIAVRDAEIRSEHAARCNIAKARHAARMLSLREFRAEVDAAATARDNMRSEMLRDMLASPDVIDE